MTEGLRHCKSQPQSLMRLHQMRTRTLTTSVNEYVQLMDSLKENLATMSDEGRARLIKSIGFEVRSIRQIYGDVVDVLFSFDEALSLDEARSKSKADPIHYSQLSDEPMVKIDWHGHLESVDTFLAATGNTLRTALTSIETCAEGIMQRLSGEMFAKGEMSEDAKNHRS